MRKQALSIVLRASARIRFMSLILNTGSDYSDFCGASLGAERVFQQKLDEREETCRSAREKIEIKMTG